MTVFENGYSLYTKFGRVTPESTDGLLLELSHRLHTLPKMSAGSQEQGAHLLPPPIPGPGEEGHSGDFTGAPTGVPRLPCCAHTPQEAGRLLPGCNAGAQVEATSRIFIPGPLEAPIPSFC